MLTLSTSSMRDLMHLVKLNSGVRDTQVQHFPLASDTKMGNWGVPLVNIDLGTTARRKQILEKVWLWMLVHISIPLKYRLPQLVGKKSCLFSPCSVGYSHSCETVKCCSMGNAILLWKWIQKCDILLAGTDLPVKAWRTSIGLPDGLTPIIAEPKFIDYALRMTFLRGRLCRIFTFSPCPSAHLWSLLFISFSKKSSPLISANYRLKIMEVSQWAE